MAHRLVSLPRACRRDSWRGPAAQLRCWEPHAPCRPAGRRMRAAGRPGLLSARPGVAAGRPWPCRHRACLSPAPCLSPVLACLLGWRPAQHPPDLPCLPPFRAGARAQAHPADSDAGHPPAAGPVHCRVQPKQAGAPARKTRNSALQSNGSERGPAAALPSAVLSSVRLIELRPTTCPSPPSNQRRRSAPPCWPLALSRSWRVARGRLQATPPATAPPPTAPPPRGTTRC